MECSSMPYRRRDADDDAYTYGGDDENHSVFDYPPLDDPSDDDGMMMGGKGTRNEGGEKKRTSKKTTSGGRDEEEPPGAVVASASSHPYPTSISIHVPTVAADGCDRDDPADSPKRPEGERRQQPSSPPASRGDCDYDCDYDYDYDYDGGCGSLLAHHRSRGEAHFNCNRLSDAVDSYSQAVRCGLDELTERRGVVRRMMGRPDVDEAVDGRETTDGALLAAYAQDTQILSTAEELSGAHADLGLALEVAQKYPEAKVEYTNALGMLVRTAGVSSKSDERVKRLRSHVKRMGRLCDNPKAEGERRKLLGDVDDAARGLHRAKAKAAGRDDESVDRARRALASSIKKLMRHVRSTLGERSYGHAKLKLKLAKVKSESVTRGESNGGRGNSSLQRALLKDAISEASSSARTIMDVLGPDHTLVGVACAFVAGLCERRLSFLQEEPPADIGGGEDGAGGMSPECKDAVSQALEFYASALRPLKFKYDNSHRRDGDGVSDGTNVRPDLGEVHHKMARLYEKKGSHASSVESYRSSLEAYGAGNDANLGGDVAKKKGKVRKSGTGDNLLLHPEAANVWHDLSSLHLSAGEYNDAVHASAKCVEVTRLVLRRGGASHDELEALPLAAHQIAGDAYAGLGRYDDAVKSYEDGRYELKRMGGNSVVDSIAEARVLHKLGMALYHQHQQAGGMKDKGSGGGDEKLETAKVHLLDALRVLRSNTDKQGQVRGDSSPDFLPSLLADIGMLHIQCRDMDEAKNALRTCLKLYEDRCMSDKSEEVVRARKLLNEAQRGGNIVAARLSVNPPSKSSKGGEVSSALETPRSVATALTLPSTSSRSATISASTVRSGRGQLQTLLEELTEDVGGESPKDIGTFEKSRARVDFSPVNSLQGGTPQNDLAKRIDTSKIAKLPFQNPASTSGTASSYEMQRLHTQIEEATQLVQKYQNRIREVEAERDAEKKGRIEANVAHRKEMETVTQDNVENAVLKSEVEALRKEVNVSERSYQALVEAIDKEKENILQCNDAKVSEMQSELNSLRDQLKDAGAVENNRLSDDLETKTRELNALKERNQVAAQEITVLQANLNAVQAEKEAAANEIASLKSRNAELEMDVQRKSAELSTAKLHSANHASNANSMIEMKKLQFELQSERSRRLILEASLQKEYDDGNNPHAGNGGGYPYPVPFGYPPMPYHTNNMGVNHTAKLKTLEIDLATEKAGKEMLENVIKELRATHEQEKDAMQSQYSSAMASHEEEISGLIDEIGAKRAEIDVANQTLLRLESTNDTMSRQLEDTLGELTDMKQRLIQTSHDLSASTEERQKMSSTISKLENSHDELLEIRDHASKLKVELKNVKDNLRRKETESQYLSKENGRLKREYNEAITMFESEMDQSKAARGEIETTVDQLQDELDTSKVHLKNVLDELEAAQGCIKELETDAQRLQTAVDMARNDFRATDEQLQATRKKNRELAEVNVELESSLTKLEGVIAAENKDRSDKKEEFEKLQNELRASEQTIKEKSEALADLTSETSDIVAKLSSMEDAMRSIPKKFETLLPSLDLCDSSSDVTSLIKQVDIHIRQLKSDIESKDKALTKTEYNLANAANDLDTLESKNRSLKESLADMESLQSDYDELVEEYAALQKVQEERDLFESRLKEAVDDLEELEGERDAVRSELAKAQDQFAEKEASLSNRITALETDNKLIETLETQALELDAALSEKNSKIAKLTEELENAMKKVDELEPEARKSLPADEDDCDDIYPDAEVLFSKVWSEKNVKSPNNPFDDECAQPSVNPFDETSDYANPFDGDSSRDERSTSNDSQDSSDDTEDAGEDEVAKLKARIIDLEQDIERMNQEKEGNIDEIELGREREVMAEEIGMLKRQVQSLEESNKLLNDQLEECGEEMRLSTIAHDNDNEAISELQKALEEKNDKHSQDIHALRNQVDHLQAQNDALKEELQSFQCEPSSSFPAIDHPSALQSESFHQTSQDEQQSCDNEIASLNEHVQALEEDNEELSAQLSEVEARLADLTRLHEHDQERITHLRCSLDEKVREEKLLAEQNDKAAMDMLQTVLKECDSESEDEPTDHKDEVDALSKEIAGLKEHVETLEDYNKELTTRLAKLTATEEKLKSQISLHDEELGVWKSKCVAAEQACNESQSALNKKSILLQTMSQQDNLHRIEAANWKSKVDELKQSNDELGKQLSDAISKQYAAKDEMKERDELYKSEVSTWKAKVGELELSNDELSRHLSDLMNKHPAANDGEDEPVCLNESEDMEIQHNLEMATVNAEFHNAMNKLEELQKENEKLKGDIETLSTMEKTEEDRNFEKEMNAAHERFVSMEKALEDRASRLEREKDKLIADFNREMTDKEEAHSRTKVELSAWKLEMQNALNDIEALKRERDELKERVQTYATTLESMCARNVELEDLVGRGVSRSSS